MGAQLLALHSTAQPQESHLCLKTHLPIRKKNIWNMRKCSSQRQTPDSFRFTKREETCLHSACSQWAKSNCQLGNLILKLLLSTCKARRDPRVCGVWELCGTGLFLCLVAAESLISRALRHLLLWVCSTGLPLVKSKARKKTPG